MSFSSKNIFLSPEKDCPYLDNQTSMLQHYIDPIDLMSYQTLLKHGWRRFGRHFFAPVCDGCFECKSVRVLVDEFVFSRSYKRVLSNGKDIDLIIQKPAITSDHLRLYHKYHNFKANTKGWRDETQTTIDDYYLAFVDGANEYGFEFAYYLDSKLIAVALVDMLPVGYSAIYCYYDPDFARLSLGTFSILKQIQIAKQNGVPYLYLGYMVEANQSLRYKSRFKPFEILQGRPMIDEKPSWTRIELGAY